MAGAYLEILQGDSYSFSTNVLLNGASQNVQGAYLWFVAKSAPEWQTDTQANIYCSTNTGQIAISGANNDIVTLTMNSATTANYLQGNSLWWALRAQLSNGSVYTLDRGRAAVTIPVVITT